MNLRHLLASNLLATAAVTSALKLPLQRRQEETNTTAPANSTINTTAHTIPLHATLYGSRFHAPLTVGSETFNLLVDTGSSDTFVISEDFECYGLSSYTNELIEVRQTLCGYDSAAYSRNASHTFEQIPDESFQAIYGAGIARGLMATEDITLGGVTVTDQRFGLVNWSTPMSLGASGVFGLAYPAITSAYELNGTIDADNLTYQGEVQPYPPLFVSMYRRGLVEAYFSLALDRLPSDRENGNGGVMVLGGVPEDVKVEGNWTSVPAEFYEEAEFRSRDGSRLRSYWATTVQRITYGGSAGGRYTTSYQTIVDSGSPSTSVPRDVATDYNRRFSPPGVWNEVQQAYIVDCNANAPAFSVQVGGTTFDLNPADLILHTGQNTNGNTKLCLSAITPGVEVPLDEQDATNTTELYILGAPFMKGVVSVFDFGNSQMRFAKREESAAFALTGLETGRLVFFVVVVALVQGFF